MLSPVPTQLLLLCPSPSFPLLPVSLSLSPSLSPSLSVSVSLCLSRPGVSSCILILLCLSSKILIKILARRKNKNQSNKTPPEPSKSILSWPICYKHSKFDDLAICPVGSGEPPRGTLATPVLVLTAETGLTLSFFLEAWAILTPTDATKQS